MLNYAIHMLRVSCQKGPTRHAYAWQIGPFSQDTLDVTLSSNSTNFWTSGCLVFKQRHKY